jgi:benzoyl-CoA 2,3-dioxygenase component B
MRPVYDPGAFAGWISPPAVGIDDRSADFPYVRIG